jgi:hypothetical protein
MLETDFNPASGLWEVSVNSQVVFCCADLRDAWRYADALAGEDEITAEYWEPIDVL